MLGRASSTTRAALAVADADLRRRKLHHLFDALTRHHHLANGACEVASEAGAVGAAALWDPPGKRQHTRAEELRQLPGLLLAFRRALRRPWA